LLRAWPRGGGDAQQNSPAARFSPAGRSADRDIPAWYAGGGKHHLPELQHARPEGAGKRCQVVAPHAMEAFVIFFTVLGAELLPGRLELPQPRHQRRIVVGAEIVPVFHDEEAFDRLAELLWRRQHAIGEDVFVGPGVAMSLAEPAADGMEHEEP